MTIESKSTPIKSVFVVGAGAAGATLALTLCRHRKRIRIVDKRSQKRSLQPAIGLQPRIFEILMKLDVFERIRHESLPLLGNKVYVDGQLAHELKFFDPKTGEYPLTIKKDTVEAILLDELALLGVPVAFEAEISEIANMGEDFVPVLDSRLDVTWDILVGCDGVNSTVRRLAGIGFKVISTDQNCFLANCKLTGAYDRNFLYFFLKENKRLVVLPVLGSDQFIVSGKTTYNERSKNHGHSIIKSLFDELSPFSPDSLEVLDFRYYSQRTGIADQFVKQNLFLCGDAAHVFPPNGAQGMNVAIENAYALAGLILQGNPVSQIRIEYGKLRSLANEKLAQTVETKRKYTSSQIKSLDSEKEQTRVQREEL